MHELLDLISYIRLPYKLIISIWLLSYTTSDTYIHVFSTIYMHGIMVNSSSTSLLIINLIKLISFGEDYHEGKWNCTSLNIVLLSFFSLRNLTWLINCTAKDCDWDTTSLCKMQEENINNMHHCGWYVLIVTLMLRTSVNYY